jgi:hypothetical protein
MLGYGTQFAPELDEGERIVDSPVEVKTKMETFEDAVNYVLTFGQYSGETIGDVWKKDFGYIKWLNTNEKTDAIIKKAIVIINEASKASRGNGNV